MKLGFKCQASVFSLVLSHRNTHLEWQTLKPSLWCVTALGSWTDHVIALRQISVTALFYLENSRKIHPRGVRACRPKDTKRREWGSEPAHGRERARTLWLLLPYVLWFFFFLPWACPMSIGLARSAVCPSWGPHSSPQTFLVLFLQAFPFLAF